jgi:D-arabinose 1-dehydrogenase-like Zn-dependent alcohol dehydrogenase
VGCASHAPATTCIASGDFTGLSVDGGFADFVLVSERSLLKLPAGVSRRRSRRTPTRADRVPRGAASPFAPGTTAAVTASAASGNRGAVRAQLGASRVVAVDTDERRRRPAGELERTSRSARPRCAGDRRSGRGRRSTSSAPTRRTPTRLHPRAWRHARSSVTAAASATNALVVNEHAVMANLVGTWIDLWEILQLHAAGRITLKTETHPLEQVNDVLAKLQNGEVTGRAVLVPGV